MVFSPALLAYQALTRLLEPLAPRLLDARVAKGKEDPARVDERLGQPGLPRPDGPLVWIHGVSVGEALSILPLAERIRKDRPDVTVLVTTGTLTSAQVLATRLPPGVIHQFAPVDAPSAVASFLDHWRPDVGVFVESELWPNLLATARKRGVPLALVSARITDRTAEGWRKAPGMARALMAGFSHVWPQDQDSADRLTALGARVDSQVNLKLSGEPLPYDQGEFSRLSALIDDRPVVVAASTHEHEETAIVGALDHLADRLFLIVVPRHPERGDGVAEGLARDGYRFARRSQGQAICPDTDIYLADTLGELGLFLRLADVVVMGGSFAPALGGGAVGGHNPLEPARLAKPIVTGPDASNWQSVTRMLKQAGGLVSVLSPAELPAVVAPLLADPEAARDMGERARRAASEAAAGLDRLWLALQAHLPAAPSRRRR
ncbi:3-deoxy-D-manno-octulosonic acid transferase [Brevundimonas naejangsanensis]|uniref:3-deoxy-D-manno-octulosonic acid transferase n=1 Tax=Brevundimonas naejangsanensis TaxID=588932 RepID=A0A494RL07_9CAUL|nr:3-deoxy-D-manno-octulosonic acid transferase [Brevundimonas naejangsanensis]AYG95260.1 3-deoxy-D-manno-octulosonic acid transferase [Brevundimonas naejangsanensis]